MNKTRRVHQQDSVGMGMGGGPGFGEGTFSNEAIYCSREDYKVHLKMFLMVFNN